jgi:flagellar secretion chaperone FliS
MDPRLAYREAAAQNGNPLHLVVLAYEQLAHDLQCALSALESREIEKRTRALDHALVVLSQLQAGLDLGCGGEVARNLDRFYNTLRVSLLQAQFQASAEILRKAIAHVLSLREAWIEVERAGASEAQKPFVPETVVAENTSADRKPRDWRG